MSDELNARLRTIVGAANVLALFDALDPGPAGAS